MKISEKNDSFFWKKKKDKAWCASGINKLINWYEKCLASVADTNKVYKVAYWKYNLINFLQIWINFYINNLNFYFHLSLHLVPILSSLWFNLPFLCLKTDRKFLSPTSNDYKILLYELSHIYRKKGWACSQCLSEIGTVFFSFGSPSFAYALLACWSDGLYSKIQDLSPVITLSEKFGSSMHCSNKSVATSSQRCFCSTVKWLWYDLRTQFSHTKILCYY